MSEIKDLSPEEITKRAWERWREMDFSWDGLALPYNVEINDERGARQIDWKANDGANKTLQRYWLIDPQTGDERTYKDLVANKEIIEAPGQKPYHIVHLPLYYDAEETQPTVKQQEPDKIRQKISEVISERILAIWEPKGEKRISNFLWLNGAVLQDVEFDHSKREDQLIAVFDDAIFTEYFELTHFAKNVAADFERAVFLGYANFSGVDSSDELNFENSHFLQIVNFSKFNINYLNLNQCFVNGNIYFDNSKINYISAVESIFNSQFRSSYLLCNSGKFDGVRFNKNISFISSKFSESIIFLNCDFFKIVEFLKCTLSDVFFRDSTLYDYFHFYGSILETLDFERVKWPKDFDKCRKVFENTTFLGTVSFAGGTPTSFAAFYGALFKWGVRFDQVTEAEAAANFQRELNAARNHWRNEAPASHIFLSHFGFAAKSYRSARDQLLLEIESGCRALKQAMANTADKNMEQIFYRFETLARRYQSKTSVPEKIISRIYQLSSRYGASYMRPMSGLLIICLLFSAAYWPLSQKSQEISWPYAEQSVAYFHHPNPKHDNLLVGFVENLSSFRPPVVGERYVEVLSVSAGRIFPFGAFENTSDEFAKTVDAKGKWAGFAFKLLGTLESFLALTLAFMFGLAVKRRFQIV
ncbi:hypothetical protein [Asticcacaulis sp. 201]|uniref:hypothetical protein n=1 Tax=Asticcacaulis sp. 201 TaxID=3028787 RepID=UPI002916B129|nr:hypothetical protein [Asticcacaulis sp. 201]MDV6333153.1 hypothetical protein [Asticcacaulis sp. 201]